MSRHRAVGRMIQTEGYLEEELDDEFEQCEDEIDQYHDSNFSNQELLDINQLEFEFDQIFNKKQIIDALYETEGNLDAARVYLTKKMSTRPQALKTLEKKEKKTLEQQQQQQKQQLQQKQQQQQQQLQDSDLGLIPQLIKQSSSEQKSKIQFNQDFNLQRYNQPYPSINYKTKQETQEIINIIMVGHVDTGKSTLVGRLLYSLKSVDEKELHKNTKEAKRIGKESFVYAFMSDQTAEEQKKGITMDMAYKMIQLNGKKINLLDSPGHLDFIPSLITGATQAEYAIFTVDVVQNAFQSSLRNGLVNEKIYLIKALGIKKLIIAINKMDQIQWDQKQYFAVVSILKDLFYKIGYFQEQITFIPISAFQGQNITQNHKECDWYKGDCLTQCLDKLEVKERNNNRPLRLVITNKYHQYEGKLRGTCIFGKIESGQVEKGQNYTIQPNGILCKVKDIVDTQQKCAFEGSIVELSIQTLLDIEFQNIKQGCILTSIEYPIPCSNLLLCEIVTLDIEYPIIRGTQFMLHINASKIGCVIKKMNRILEDGSNQTKRKFPRAICANERAEVEIECDVLACVEINANMKSLSQFVLREKFKTIALGVVVEIKMNMQKLKESKVLHEQQV